MDFPRIQTPPPPNFPGFGERHPKSNLLPLKPGFNKAGNLRKAGKAQENSTRCRSTEKATGTGRKFPDPDNLFGSGNLKCFHFSHGDVGIPGSRLWEFQDPGCGNSGIQTLLNLTGWFESKIEFWEFWEMLAQIPAFSRHNRSQRSQPSPAPG